MRRILPMTLTVALLLVACGSDGAEVDPAADQEAADQEAADAAIAALGTYLEGEGFAVVPEEEEDEEDDELVFESEECQDLKDLFSEDDAPEGETASADSDEFQRGEFEPPDGAEETIEASVGFVEDQSTLDEIFALFGDGRLAGCMEEAMRLSIEEAADAAEDAPETEILELNVEPVDIGDLGDDSFGLAIEMSFEVFAMEFDANLQMNLVRDGRSAVFVMASVFGTGDPAELADEALNVILTDLDA